MFISFSWFAHYLLASCKDWWKYLFWVNTCWWSSEYQMSSDMDAAISTDSLTQKQNRSDSSILFITKPSIMSTNLPLPTQEANNHNKINDPIYTAFCIIVYSIIKFFLFCIHIYCRNFIRIQIFIKLSYVINKSTKNKVIEKFINPQEKWEKTIRLLIIF